ncbi:MAG: phospholipase D-like domain-containing protein [bacterium]
MGFLGQVLVAFLLLTSCGKAENIQPFFINPLDNQTQNLTELIGQAKKSIDIAIYSFSRKDILNALLSAKKRGVKTRVVTEGESYDDPQYSPFYKAMQKAGIPIKCNMDDRSLMHDKFMIIDRERVWTGSANITTTDMTVNANDALLISGRDLAKAYTLEFEQMFEKNRWGTTKYDSNEELFDIDGKRVEVYFAPSDEPESQILKAIGSATQSIYMAIFYLTNDRMYKALKDAVERGVEVKGVFDERGASDNNSEALRLVRSGNGVIDALSGLVHHKFCIIDKSIVIAGSANWSRSAMNRNDENTLIIHSPKIALAYLSQWNRLYEDSACIYPTSCDNLPPAPPRVTCHHYNKEQGCVRIEWNTAQDKATGYKIYRAERSGGPYQLLKEISKKEAEGSQDYRKIGKIDGIEGSYYAHYDDIFCSSKKYKVLAEPEQKRKFLYDQNIPQTTYYYAITTLVSDVESKYSNEYSEAYK